MIERIQDFVEVSAFQVMRRMRHGVNFVRDFQEKVEGWFKNRRQRVTRLFVRD